MPDSAPTMTARKLDRALTAAIASDDIRIEPLPAATTKLVNLINQGDFSLRAVAEIVASDQALAAYVLRQASSAGRAGRDIDSIDDAVAVMGAKEIMSMAVALGMGSQVCAGGPLQELKLEVWRRATFSAAFCRAMARHFGATQDQAFLVGLLSNLGLSVALSCIEEALPDNSSQSMPREFWLRVAKRHERTLGLVMAAKWELPPFVRDVQSALGDTDHLPEDPLARLVAVGERVADVVESESDVTDDMLANIAGLEDEGHRAAIIDLLHTLGAQMCSLNPEQPDDPERSAVAVDETSPLVIAVQKIREKGPANVRDDADATAVELGATVHQGKNDIAFQCVAMIDDGLVMQGGAGLPANWMVKMTLHSQPDLTFCGTAVYSEGDGKGHFVGIRRMSLSPDDQVRWTGLVNGAAANDEATPPAVVDVHAVANDEAPARPGATTGPRNATGPRNVTGPRKTTGPRKATGPVAKAGGTSVQSEKGFFKKIFSR